MRKLFYAFAVILGISVSASCSKMENTNYQATDITLSYAFCEQSSGSMYPTKANGDAFGQFYEKITNGSMVADDYTVEFTEIGGDTHYTVNGKWSGDCHASIKPGKYHVTGYATDAEENIQSKCSIKLDDTVEVTSDGGKIMISAGYDCSLIIFHDSSIKAIYNCNGKDAPKEFFKDGEYFYAFVHTNLYDAEHKDDAYILEQLTDGSEVKTSTKDLTCENGKYYVYGASSTGFNLGQMESGFDNGTTAAPVVTTGDVFSVSMSTAGTLKDAFGETDPLTIKSIMISGVMDARDFNTIKWECRNLEVMDLSNVKIVAYSGDEGTNEGYDYYYDANAIPLGACFYWTSNSKREVTSELYDEGMKTLKKVVLPVGVTSIGRNAFARAYNLSEINFPEGLTRIDYVAFRYCTSLSTISFPSTLAEIGEWAFTTNTALKEVHIKAIVPPTLISSFGLLADAEGQKGSVNPNDYTKMTSATLYVPKGYLNTYKESSWADYFATITEE